MALKDIIGQDKAINILLGTIQRGRVPSSYLFAGESGIGKKFTAVNLAKAVNCLKTAPPELRTQIDACDKCLSCKKIDASTHPDFLLISPENGQIRVEEIRKIEGLLSLKPFEGRKKIVIVDDADKMNLSAANAFLKTLEEPPEDSLIILISSNPDRLPSTIRSRCSRINFTPLSDEDCKRVVSRYLSNQKTTTKTNEIMDTKLTTLIRLSMGRPGIAIQKDIIEVRAWFIKLLKGMLNKEKDGWKSREEMERWIDLMLILLRDMATSKITGDEAYLINADLKDYLRRLSHTIDLKVIIENYQKLNTLKGYLNFNLNKALTWNYTGSLLRKTMDVKYA
ncbi:MAG: DNA polymerase III subunit delta' [Nitrospirota bacterium]